MFRFLSFEESVDQLDRHGVVDSGELLFGLHERDWKGRGGGGEQCCQLPWPQHGTPSQEKQCCNCRPAPQEIDVHGGGKQNLGHNVSVLKGRLLLPLSGHTQARPREPRSSPRAPEIPFGDSTECQ